ncbi:conjugal transfer protein TraW [Zooshikella marina]|uniref:conjugal transfer protein TraW n=1 Tax=Zooshikella ganghwensis TaxID=202772 RepID=UPI001BB051D5|nr:conjugal transfer protein TraW [Zooshikella ganghwensis]MBU2708733.1 conjugal transfer protein TraW [Zooshikella ganghwensis]
MKLKKARTVFLSASISSIVLLSSPVFAGGWPVHDAITNFSVGLVNKSVLGVTMSVNAMNTSVTQMLYNVGMSVNQNGTKISHTVEAASRVEREFAVVQERNKRVEDARQRYKVSASICSENVSGGAVTISKTSSMNKSTIRPGAGGGFSDADIQKAINEPSVAPEVDSAQSAKIHTKYCDHIDYKAYGGSKACPSISEMPGGDKRIDSLLVGAGKDGKEPDLTFDPKQIDAARMYVKNSVRRSVGAQLKKGEADTTAGAQYIGLLNQYNAVISAAADPQESMIARSVPSNATKELLSEALKSSASSKIYFDQFASKVAKQKKIMSEREFEEFEAGRRYSNVEYQRDLQEMSGDNLIREQIRVLAYQNWLLLKTKNNIEKNNIISGQILASMARKEFKPELNQLKTRVNAELGSN